jgi:hypothetical protein
MNRKTAELWLPALLVTVCIAAFLGVFIHPGLVDQGRRSLATSFDLQSYFLPRFALGSSAVFHGQLPTWNRFEYGGLPLLATAQPAALYPPKVILFGLFQPVPALWIYLVLHYAALAGSFLYFLRRQGIVGLAAFVGTVVWTFSPPLLGSSYNPVRIANMIWMPLIFVFSERLAKEKTLGAFATLALLVALELVAGYPEATMDTALLISVHAVASHHAGRWKDPPWVTVPRIAASFVLGGVTAGAQMLPLAELAAIAQRKSVVSTAGAPAPELFSTLLSTVPALAVFVLIGFTVKTARPAIVGFLTCLCMVSGGWLLLRLLPGFSMTRFPYVWGFLWVFYFGWIAAEGARAVVNDAALGSRARSAALVACGLVGAVIVVAFGFEMPHLGGALDGTTAAAAQHARPLARYLGTPLAAGLGIVGGAFLVAAAVVTYRERRSAPLWGAALLALTLSHLASYPFGNIPAPFARSIKQGSVTRLQDGVTAVQGRVLSLDDLLDGFEITDAQPSPLGVEFSFLPFRFRQLLFRFKFLPILAAIDWNTFLDARGFLDAMDVELISTNAGNARTLIAHGLRAVRRSADTMLFENRGRMGHAWVNYAVVRADGEDATLDYVLGTAFDPRRHAVLEVPTTHVFPAESDAPVTAPMAERRRSDTDVEFDVELPRPGVFVFSESAYPGWRATVDGRPAPILVGNYVMRAVELDAGRHTVRFEYRPRSVTYGLLSSALGLGAIAALFVVGRRRRAVHAAETPAPLAPGPIP